MIVRYRYRVEPTRVQEQGLAQVFGSARVVFNDAIRLRESVRAEGGHISETHVQSTVITAAKRTEERSWLADVSSDALIQAVRDCHRAYRNFESSTAGRRKGRALGRPRFRSRKNSRQSVRFTKNGFRLRPDRTLYLAKIGNVRVRWSRDLPSDPSSVTIIREPDGHHYASFVVEVQTTPMPLTGQEAGIDLGLTTFATIAMDNTADLETRKVANPRHLAGKLRKLRRLEQEKSRRQRGSSNRAKTRLKIATTHGNVARARLDHHHKLALDVVRENQTIHVEDLNIAGMVRNRRLARAISDAGWAQFLRVLGDKCVRYGRDLHRIDRWHPSSQLCADCGGRSGPTSLGVRAWTCENCGARHDRDVVAARNILAAGRAERRNACGHRVSPPIREAMVDEAGTTPTAKAVRTRFPSGGRQSSSPDFRSARR